MSGIMCKWTFYTIIGEGLGWVGQALPIQVKTFLKSRKSYLKNIVSAMLP